VVLNRENRRNTRTPNSETLLLKMERLALWSAAACRRFAPRQSCPIRKQEQFPPPNAAPLADSTVTARLTGMI